jgi:hypothetical protein
MGVDGSSENSKKEKDSISNKKVPKAEAKSENIVIL